MSEDCPTCGKKCVSERGVKIHHKQAHGESLKPSVSCEWCDEVFQVRPRRLDSARFCSMECRQKHADEHHRERRECDNCGERYTVKAAEADGSRFCSRSCQTDKQREENAGPNSGRWQGGDATVTCENCGDSYEVRQAKVETTRFCSYECKGEVYAEERTGPGGTNWQGGFANLANTLRNITGRDSWRIIKAAERADECAICSASVGDSSGRNLSVHHIIPVMNGGTSEPWNLMTLCTSCHQTAEGFTKQHLEYRIGSEVLDSEHT